MKSSLRWLEKEWKNVKKCVSLHCKNNNDIVHMGHFFGAQISKYSRSTNAQFKAITETKQVKSMPNLQQMYETIAPFLKVQVQCNPNSTELYLSWKEMH